MALLPTSPWRAVIWGIGVCTAGVLMQWSGSHSHAEILACMDGRPTNDSVAQTVVTGLLRATDSTKDREGLAGYIEERREGGLRKHWSIVARRDVEGTIQAEAEIYRVRGYVPSDPPCTETKNLDDDHRMRGIADNATVTLVGKVFPGNPPSVHGWIFQGTPDVIGTELRRFSARMKWFAWGLELAGGLALVLGSFFLIKRRSRSAQIDQPVAVDSPSNGDRTPVSRVQGQVTQEPTVLKPRASQAMKESLIGAVLLAVVVPGVLILVNGTPAIRFALIFGGLAGLAVLGFYFIRFSLRSPSEITIEDAGLTIRKGIATATVWSSVKKAFHENKAGLRWRFLLNEGGEVIVRDDGLNVADWSKLSERLYEILAHAAIQVETSSFASPFQPEQEPKHSESVS